MQKLVNMMEVTMVKKGKEKEVEIRIKKEWVRKIVMIVEHRKKEIKMENKKTILVE